MSKPLPFTNFPELKKAAYRVAVHMNNHGFEANWLDHYTDQFALDSDVFIFEEVIKIYLDFLKGDLPKEESVKKITDQEKAYKSGAALVEKGFAFMLAATEALDKKDYGVPVTFVCPNCQGKAQAVRYYTPDNPRHNMTIRAKCPNCGSGFMN